MLTKIEITNYKSIASTDISLGQENIIVGPNGVGKSNLLDVVHFIRDSIRDGLDNAITKRHGIESIRRWSKTRPYNISIKLHFEARDGSGYYKVVIASGRGDFSVVEEDATWTGSNAFFDGEGKVHQCRLYRTSKEVEIFEIPSEPFSKMPRPTASASELIFTQISQSSFSPLRIIFDTLHNELVSFGTYSIYPNKIREPQSISNSEVLFDDGSNLASIVRSMKAGSGRSGKENITQSLKQVIPILNEIRIASAGGFYVPVFRVTESDAKSQHDLNMSQVSDGTLRMLGMLTAFYQAKAPEKIAIEEPEQMIHPGLLPILIDAAKDYVDYERVKRQFFLTTHSPTLLDLFDPASVISASYENGMSKFCKISDRQMGIIKNGLFTAGELMLAEGLGPQ